jgi:hypothetical protein
MEDPEQNDDEQTDLHAAHWKKHFKSPWDNQGHEFIVWNKKPILQPILGVGNMRYVSHEKAIVG